MAGRFRRGVRSRRRGMGSGGGGSAIASTLESRLIAAAGAGAFSIYTADSVTTNGSGRFRWTDATGTGGHLDAAAATNDPTVVVPGSGAFAGKNVVRLDGVDDYLTSILAKTNYKFLHGDTVPAAVLFLHLPVDSGALEWLFATSQNGSTSIGMICQASYNNGRNSAAIGNGSAQIFNQFAQGPDPANEATITEYRLESSSGYIRVESPSVDQETTAALSGAASALDPAYALSVGWRPGVGSYLETDIRAIVLLKNYTAGQLTAVRNELISEGGIT